MSRPDPCFRYFNSPVENRGPERQPRVRPPFSDSMDSVGTGKEKRDSLRVLGMQRDRQPADAELFCDLPARFGGRLEHGDAIADLPAQPLLPLYPSRAATSGERTASAGIGPTAHFTSGLRLPKMTASMIAREQIIYLDNNATTQLDPAVIEEMLPYLTEYYGNPSSGYTFGRQVRSAIDLARERVAGLLGCEPGETAFTSCGTESNNAAVNSALQLDPNRRHVVTTAVEHSATRRHCETVANRGGAVTIVGVDGNGNLDLNELEAAITPQTAIVTAMWANNETGVLFPVGKIAEIARRKRVLFHTDAIQTVGKIPIRLGDSTINSLALSAHKLHGPKGVGALYANKRSAFKPSMIGGSQENNRRAGTENVASIVALGKAAECAAATLAEEDSRVRAMRDRFENGLLERITKKVANGNPGS